MWRKCLLAGAAALSLTGATVLYAQQGPDGSSSQAQDRAAFLDARIAGLKAGLQLTPDQEKNWPAFEAAVRNLAKVRADHRRARLEEQQPGNLVERLRRRADALTSTGTALKQLADAEEPLLNSLDDAQKRRFAFFAHMARERMEGRRDHRFGGDEGGRGHRDPGEIDRERGRGSL
jgi:zinc resistance-associated protein